MQMRARIRTSADSWFGPAAAMKNESSCDFAASGN
jgi:hypothetical protein